MDILHLLDVLGIGELPQMPSDFWEEQSVHISVSDTSVIEALERDLGLLGAYYEPTLACARAVAGDRDLCEWSDRIASYIASHELGEGATLPKPRPAGDVFAYYYLLIITALVPSGIALYRARGFCEEEIRQALCPTVRDRVTVSERFSLEAGLDRSGFGWLLHYVKAQVFPAGIFNVTPRKLHEASILLRHRKSGSYECLVLSGRFHRSGVQLGSGGCTDGEGAFDANFVETEDAFIGCPVSSYARLSPERRTYPKSEWQEIVRQGGAIAGIHIPRGAVLTDENIKVGFAEAFRISRERYPEVDVRAVHCSSWILDTQLEDLLGESSRVVGFGKHFLRYPLGGDGAAVYSFVFNQKRPEDLSELKEDTSLQRKIKSLYLNGGCIYITGGFVPDDMLAIF